MNAYRHVLALVLVAIFPFALMAQTPSASPGSTGIAGIISVSPNHPGPIRKDMPNSGPAGDVQFVVKNQDNQTVATFTTDKEGGFQVAVPPGHYVVCREDGGARIGHWRFETDVSSGAMTKVHWTGDSGMR